MSTPLVQLRKMIMFVSSIGLQYFPLDLRNDLCREHKGHICKSPLFLPERQNIFKTCLTHCCQIDRSNI